ncbi:glycosyltransferase, partial [Aurantimonas marianensis]|nr:glycosyltransferase family 1 protein [Aurantimonas marianensis]
LDRFRPAPSRETQKAELGLAGRRLIGCSGRIRHQKGTDVFVDAMIAVLPRHPEWTAIVTGRVTAEHAAFDADLRRRVAAAGLNERIRFLGE